MTRQLIVKVLDTAVGENGADQASALEILARDKPIRFSASIGSGDTVLIQGKAESADSWETTHTFTENGLADVYVSNLWRVIRSVDGAVGESVIKIENRMSEDLTVHV